MKEDMNMNNKNNNSWIIGIVMFFVGVISLYGIMYFFPEPFVRTITEQKEVKNVNITDTGIADAVEKVYDAVVVVKNIRKGQLYGTGTGFVYKVENDVAYILTNNHVVEGATNIEVEFTDGSSSEVKLAAGDTYSDIAVLSVDKSKIKSVAAIGSSENGRVGDTVFAIGAPVNSSIYSNTVTRGILSGKNRLVSVSTSNSNSNSVMMSVLQTDAAINSGNSGGPLVNANGEIIGITNMKIVISSVEGMGFAIPIETAINYANVLEKGEQIQRPYLGITMLNLNEALYYHPGQFANLDVENGVYVESVEDGSAANKAGLAVGDIILQADGKTVKSAAYLRYVLYSHNVNDELQLKVLRDGKEIDIKVKLSVAKDL